MIVDDSAVMRKAIEQLIRATEDLMVCGSVASGESALEQLEGCNPDVITMDIEMPGMGGLAAIKSITARRGIPILVFSSKTAKAAELGLQALEYGAVDVLDKPSGGLSDLHRIAGDLGGRIRSFAHRIVKPPAMRHTPVAGEAIAAMKPRDVECIAIAISTGGPAALSLICNSLSARVDVPILVVQHMPRGFTQTLATRLNNQCALSVVEATNGMTAHAGQIVIGKSGHQMRVERRDGAFTVVLTEATPQALYAPSADLLFASLAEACGRRTVAFIMTGMGSDGTLGLRELKSAGGYVYAQDEATSTIYGMPRAALLAGVVDASIPLQTVAAAIEAASQGRVV